MKAALDQAQETRQGLTSRIALLTREHLQLTEKLHDEQTKLAAAIAQRPSLAVRVARGDAQPGAARELAVLVLEIETCAQGLEMLVGEKHTELTTVELELRDLEAEEARRIRETRLGELKATGTNLAKSINEQHAAVQARIGELDSLCQTLRREFVDAGGQLHAAPIDDLAVTATALLATLNQQIAGVRPVRR